MGKYFTEVQRYQLEIMLQDKIPVKQIAERLGKCVSTIYNEIKRGQVEQLSSELVPYKTYKADYAQRDFLEKQTAKGADFKIGNDFELVNFIEDKIKNEKWSPEAVIGFIRAHPEMKFKTDICYKTLYNYIHAGLFLNVRQSDLKHYHKKKKKEGKAVALHNLRGTPITERPEEIKTRNSFGHWEMDTVIGQRDKKNCLLVLSERKTRTEIIRKIKSKSQEAVKAALDQIEKDLGPDQFREHFKSITTDNGVEFLDAGKIETSISGGKRTTSYYCHPYSSWERGTNENINKMIRRWIPKGEDITLYTEKQIEYVEHWINAFPRKIFNFRSSRDMLRAELGL
ncbi:MAG: IS30 family transposase [Lachnospiraceae bacterium]|nr:IS30 family transposase [Lachnospiraceae bacterium]